MSTTTAVCTGAKAVPVRSRLYYCNWVAGSKRSYVLKDSKSIGPYSKLTARQNVTVVEPGLYGKWYAQGYVWYTKNGVRYAKSDMEFGAIGSSSKDSSC